MKKKISSYSNFRVVLNIHIRGFSNITAGIYLRPPHTHTSAPISLATDSVGSLDARRDVGNLLQYL